LRCALIVKNGRRHRYIGFLVKHSSKDVVIKKYEMIDVLKNQCRVVLNKECKELGIRLIRFNGLQGIVKCNHIEKENTIKLLNSIDKVTSYKVKVETIGTSGTIKALIRKHMTKVK